MSTSQIVPHLHEALIEAIGSDAFFGGASLEYKMIRPVPSEGSAYARVLPIETPGLLALQVDNGADTIFITGSARLGKEDR